MKVIEIDGKLYKDPTGCGLELIPIEQDTIEETFDSILEMEKENEEKNEKYVVRDFS